MSESIGLIETKGYAGSVEASDAMAKAASVTIVKQIPIGGGFLTVLVKGDVGSVKAAGRRPRRRTRRLQRHRASARRPSQTL